MTRFFTLVPLLLAAGLSACIRFDADPMSVTKTLESAAFVDPVDQAKFERGLAEAGVPYQIETRDGLRYAGWPLEHAEAASQVRATVLGEPLPKDRNASLSPPEFQEEFKGWLKEQGIPYEIRTSGGREFVVWSQEHADKVRQWSHFATFRDEAPNPSIERTSPGKPGAASHVKR